MEDSADIELYEEIVGNPAYSLQHYDPEITFKRPITQCECSLGDASASATTGDVKLTDSSTTTTTTHTVPDDSHYETVNTVNPPIETVEHIVEPPNPPAGSNIRNESFFSVTVYRNCDLYCVMHGV